jgi:hypothetical protein
VLSGEREGGDAAKVQGDKRDDGDVDERVRDAKFLSSV